MFEFLGAETPIPINQLILYYLVALFIYFVFLRNIKFTTLSLLILLLFNQGFIILLDSSNRPSKVLFIILSTLLLFKSKNLKLNKSEQRILYLFILFTFFFFMNYIINGVPLLWAGYQYYKYYVPIVLFFAIKGLNMSSEDAFYYGNLILKLILFQVAFSILKIAIIGFRENITGTISNLGGGIGIGYAIMGTILYWAMNNKDLQGKDWIYVLSFLIIPIASNKRAIWFIFPIIILLIMYEKIIRLSARRVAYIIILVPFLIYFGFRLNPSLNPERKLWGSFNFNYAINYALSYSGVSEEQLESTYAQGRWGASTAIIKTTFQNPFSRESLLGYGRSRTGYLSEEFNPVDYGLIPGTMISKIGVMIIQMGWLATLLIILIFINMIYTIPDKKIANIIAFYVLWDTIFYSGSMIDVPVQSILLVLVIMIIRYLKPYNKMNNYYK